MSNSDCPDYPILSMPENYQENLPFRGFWFPVEILYNSSLIDTQKLILCEIAELQKNGYECFASNAYLARILCKTEKQISENINKIKKMGFITIKNGNGGKRTITVNFEALIPGYIKKLKDNIKYLADGKQPEELDPNKFERIFRVQDTLRSLLGQSNIPPFQTGGYPPFKLKDTPLSNGNRGTSLDTSLDTKKVSKDTYSFSEKKTEESNSKLKSHDSLQSNQKTKPDSKQNANLKLDSKTKKIISQWNSLPKPASKHVKMNTKLIVQVRKYIKQLDKGTFFDGKTWDWNWLHICGITSSPDPKITRLEAKEKINSLTPRSISRVLMHEAPKAFLEGYEPCSKSILPTALSTFLFNPFGKNKKTGKNAGGKSFFVQWALKPVEPVKITKIEDPHPHITEFLTSEGFIKPDDLTPSEWRQYVKNLGFFEDMVKDGINFGHHNVYGLFKDGSDLLPLIKNYVGWMQGGYMVEHLLEAPMLDNFHFRLINPKFWMFECYMKAINNYYGEIFYGIPHDE